MKAIIRISYEENQEVQVLIEKREALKNLIQLLQEKQMYIEMQERAKEEYTEICKEYAFWWENIIAKYHLQKYESPKLRVDCAKQIILYEDGVS